MDENNNQSASEYHFEQALLGAILSDGHCWDIVADKISVEHLKHQAHKAAYQAMQSLALQNNPIDIFTVNGEINRLALLPVNNDVLQYLNSLRANSVSSANVGAYVDAILKEATLTRIKSVGIQISMLASETIEPSEMIDKAEGMIFQIQQSKVRGTGLIMIQDMMNDYIVSFEEQAHPALPTGFTGIDDILSGGMRPGELIIIAGRPASGKTSLAMNIAEYVVLQLKKRALVFSLEMSQDQLLTRLVSAMTGIDGRKLLARKLEEMEFIKLSAAMTLLADAKLKIDFTPKIKPSELRARARREARENKDLALIVIDYIGLMGADDKHNGNKVNELAELSAALKSLAKELNVPVLTLAQLNRNSVNRVGDKRPMMSDLRDSGALEQDADVVMLIYRDEVYNKNSNNKGIAEIIIDKNRSGCTGVVELGFEGTNTRFYNDKTRSLSALYRG